MNFDSPMVSVLCARLIQRTTGRPDDGTRQSRSDYRFSIFNIQDSIEYFIESKAFGRRSSNLLSWTCPTSSNWI